MELRGGALLIDKPEGPTSHDVVAKVRRIAGLRRVGHAGTLDPFASGLLVLLLGPATRLSEYLLGMDKDYEATARLGVETSTDDPEGDILAESHAWRGLTVPDAEAALSSFLGSYLQTPPVYSAKKIQGESAHRRVRRGETVKMKEVEVTVHEIELLELNLPALRFRVRCSSGTYVRALARDLGRKLGAGAHLTALRRTSVGSFRVEDALTMEGLDGNSWRDHVLSPAQVVAHLPSVSVGPEDALRLKQGQRVPVEAGVGSEGVPVRVLVGEELLAIGAVTDGELRPRKVMGG